VANLENALELSIVKLRVNLNARDALEIRVVFEPLVEVALGISFDELVSAADTEHHQAIKIVRVRVMCILERKNCLVVKIVFLVQLSQHSPGFGVILIYLNFSFQAKQGLLYLTLVHKFLRFR